ncbi:MAG: hypothetical protein AB1758_16040 [Candidatus Eremiobacterota bacterium]
MIQSIRLSNPAYQARPQAAAGPGDGPEVTPDEVSLSGSQPHKGSSGWLRGLKSLGLAVALGAALSGCAVTDGFTTIGVSPYIYTTPYNYNYNYNYYTPTCTYYYNAWGGLSYGCY